MAAARRPLNCRSPAARLNVATELMSCCNPLPSYVDKPVENLWSKCAVTDDPCTGNSTRYFILTCSSTFRTPRLSGTRMYRDAGSRAAHSGLGQGRRQTATGDRKVRGPSRASYFWWRRRALSPELRRRFRKATAGLPAPAFRPRPRSSPAHDARSTPSRGSCSETRGDLASGFQEEPFGRPRSSGATDSCCPDTSDRRSCESAGVAMAVESVRG